MNKKLTPKKIIARNYIYFTIKHTYRAIIAMTAFHIYTIYFN